MKSWCPLLSNYLNWPYLWNIVSQLTMIMPKAYQPFGIHALYDGPQNSQAPQISTSLKSKYSIPKFPCHKTPQTNSTCIRVSKSAHLLHSHLKHLVLCAISPFEVHESSGPMCGSLTCQKRFAAVIMLGLSTTIAKSGESLDLQVPKPPCSTRLSYVCTSLYIALPDAPILCCSSSSSAREFYFS